MRVTTSQKVHFLLSVFLLLAFFLPGCGPSQTEIDATATQNAEKEIATLTAQAPTATFTPTMTRTPTSTATPTSTPTITPSPTSTPVPTETPVPTLAPPVEMDPFVSFSSGFTYEFEFPKGWENEIRKIGGGEFISIAMAPDQSAALEIYNADLISVGYENATLEEYTDADIEYQLEIDPSFELVTRESTTNANGLPVEIFVYKQQDGAITAKKQLYVHEGKMAIVLTYYTRTNNYEVLLPIIDYTFAVFDVSE